MSSERRSLSAMLFVLCLDHGVGDQVTLSFFHLIFLGEVLIVQSSSNGCEPQKNQLHLFRSMRDTSSANRPVYQDWDGESLEVSGKPMSASDQDQQVAGRWGAARRRRRRRAETQAFPVGVNVKAAPAPFGRTKVSVGTDAWYDKDDTEKIWGS